MSCGAVLCCRVFDHLRVNTRPCCLGIKSAHVAWREASKALIVLGAKFEIRKYAKYAREMANLAGSHSL